MQLLSYRKNLLQIAIKKEIGEIHEESNNVKLITIPSFMVKQKQISSNNHSQNLQNLKNYMRREYRQDRVNEFNEPAVRFNTNQTDREYFTAVSRHHIPEKGGYDLDQQKLVSLYLPCRLITYFLCKEICYKIFNASTLINLEKVK
ncbi:hypothetical protein TTHERM_00554580 (macronuclear) [Tetrahymena thermophila SB210]|uniref:Uncharacterized protein n=1 Tax=Tetrahymena thermophila (strain SB210) TaxID=312017 RepID=Q22UG7_TETTS|nr:hypothetical protein TTHERM_00554580 [Tetrahymena thermophila SB210]EAR89003.1 hypothetical protein TTHERM_00554580 [Tetrahymena thermophila SB210]|eukprot:XP_001009248.1 hypothetical protein TTHERM_00554580 [Tetrahymena thermophila SB210]